MRCAGRTHWADTGEKIEDCPCTVQHCAVLVVGEERAKCDKCKGSGKVNEWGEAEKQVCAFCPNPAEQLSEGLAEFLAIERFCSECRKPIHAHFEKSTAEYCSCEVYVPVADPTDLIRITHRILRIKPWEGWENDMKDVLAPMATLQQKAVATGWKSLCEALGITLEIDCDEPGCEGGYVFIRSEKLEPTGDIVLSEDATPCPKCGGGR
jgi:hypothetical protein